jgi:uncharacterized membrane protein YfcA
MIINLLLIGLVGGFCSGLLGIGGGAVFVPLLTMVAGLSIREAMGVSLCVVVPTALVGFLKSYSLGYVNLKISLLVVITSIIGSYLGVAVMSMMPVYMLKRIFAIFLVLIAANILLSGK